MGVGSPQSQSHSHTANIISSSETRRNKAYTSMVTSKERSHSVAAIVGAVVLALLAALFMLFAGFCVSGAGEGWFFGAFASLPLAVVSFGSVYCAIVRRQHRRMPMALLLLGIATCALAALATFLDLDKDYSIGFTRVVTYHADLLVLYAMACSIWLGASLSVVLRKPSAPHVH